MISLPTIFAASACKGGSFLGLPTWYAYLPQGVTASGGCAPALRRPGDLWLVVAAIVEMLLRIAALVAVAMIIYGGIQFITSEGDPEKANGGRKTVVGAVVGLVIAVSAATVVTFIAGSFK
jgi:type IV secretory pathway VirB2 component (pilin)